jgi:hypothetical protein
MGNSNMEKIGDFIPCIFRRNSGKADKILIYFHGNNEDLAQAFRFVQYFQYRMEVHIIVVEYPGYGVYDGTPNETNVLSDAHRVIEFCTKVLRWKSNDLIVMGRSIGTGPA